MNKEEGKKHSYLSDIYAFGDWLKRCYQGEIRKPLKIEPLSGGVIRVTIEHEKAMTHTQIVLCKKCGMPCSGSFSDPVNLEKLCINCWYALKTEEKKQ
jgi:hypothetical protein